MPGPGEKTVEANGRGTKLPSTPLHEQVGLAAAPGAPDQHISQGGGSKGHRDSDTQFQVVKGSLAGQGPMVVLAPSCEPRVLQSIVLDDVWNDSASSDELDNYSSTASLTSSNALGSSTSSSCDDAPSVTVLESYQDCSPCYSAGHVDETPRRTEELL